MAAGPAAQTSGVRGQAAGPTQVPQTDAAPTALTTDIPHSTAAAQHNPSTDDYDARVGKTEVGRAPQARRGVVQARLTVGRSNDHFEQEADHVASRVMSRSATLGRPAITPLASFHGVIASASQEGYTTRSGGTAPMGVDHHVTSVSGRGPPLDHKVRTFMESRFGRDFGAVRVHGDAASARAADLMDAHAFTVGHDIFFGPGRYRPGTPQGNELIAHELTHTVQQMGEPTRVQRQTDAAAASASYVPQWLLDKVASYAHDMPGYTLLSAILGKDPISGTPVAHDTTSLIREVLHLFPNGDAIFQNLQETKSIQEFGAYFDQQVALLNLSWASIKALVQDAWNSLGARDLLNPAGAWEKIKARFQAPLDRLMTFVTNFGGHVISVIKRKVLSWLRTWALKLKGYNLLTFVLGKDPFTDQVIVRSPTAFTKAVFALVPGGDGIYANLQRSRAIERTVTWLNQEIAKLDLTWAKIKALFSQAWDVISITDLLNPLGFAGKIRGIFEPPAGRVVNFALAVGKKVLTFIFEGAMLLAGPTGKRIIAILEKSATAFQTIVANPVAFLHHLVDALKLGFGQFVAKIGVYLEAGVVAWLTGAFEGAGIVLPKKWDLQGILSLVLQVLGITYAKMRAKMVKVLGEERVAQLENGFAFVKALVTEGPAAAWQKITESIGNFRSLVIGGIENWAIVKIIKVAVVQLLAMFNPVGAVVESIIEIYRAVSFFVQRMNQIFALAEAVVDSIANIAAGQIGAAANYVERTLARTIPVIIGFLASMIGLGDVSQGIRKVIDSIQQAVERGIDSVIAWIVAQVRAMFGKGTAGDQQADKKGDLSHDQKWAAGVAGVKAELVKLDDAGKLNDDIIRAALPAWKDTYGFSSLALKESTGGTEIDGAMSPSAPVVSGHSGDQTDPFPIEYPKPRDAYLPLYFGRETASPTLQADNENDYKDPVKRAARGIKEYKPFPGASQPLPNGTKIGIVGKYALNVGDLIGPLSKTGTPGGGVFNDPLKKYGYSSSTEKLQSDHYWEIQCSGGNVLENLWPLERELNGKSGNYIKNLEVMTLAGPRKVSALKKDVQKYWLKIVGFRRPP